MPALTITNAGRQAAIDAANQGLAVSIETVAVGSGRYTPDGTETALQTQLASVAIANARQLDDQLALYSLFTAGQWTAYELGLFLDDGSLFAVVSDGPAGDVLYTKDAANLAITVNLLLTTVPIGSVTVAANLLFQLGNDFVRKAGDTMTGDLLTVTPPAADDSKKAVNSEWVKDRIEDAGALFFFSRTSGSVNVNNTTWAEIFSFQYTPRTTTSKILLTLLFGGAFDRALTFRLRRGGASILSPTLNLGGIVTGFGFNTSAGAEKRIVLSDEPASTAQQTYYVDCKRASGSEAFSYWPLFAIVQEEPESAVIAKRSADLDIASGTWTEFLSITMDVPTAARKVLLRWLVLGTVIAQAGTSAGNFRIRRGNTIIFGPSPLSIVRTGNESRRTIPAMIPLFVDTPGAGSHTYRFDVSNDAAAQSWFGGRIVA